MKKSLLLISVLFISCASFNASAKDYIKKYLPEDSLVRQRCESCIWLKDVKECQKINEIFNAIEDKKSNPEEELKKNRATIELALKTILKDQNYEIKCDEYDKVKKIFIKILTENKQNFEMDRMVFDKFKNDPGGLVFYTMLTRKKL